MASMDAFVRYCENTCNKDLSRCKDLTEETSIQIIRNQRSTSRKRIIALGFFRGLTRADVNRILVGCGFPQLYVRNLVELTIGYALDRHSCNPNESVRDALNQWLSIYQEAEKICEKNNKDELSDLSEGIKLKSLKKIILEQSPEERIYGSMTTEGSRFTTYIERAVKLVKSDEDLVQLITEEAPQLRIYRANARLMFIRYLVFCIESIMKCYWIRQDNRPILNEMYYDANINYACWDSVRESIQEIPIRLHTVVEMLYEYYDPVGDNMFFGSGEDDSDEDGGSESGDPVDNLVAYFRGVIKGEKDITRPMLLFFALFANQKILDALGKDQRVSLDENRLNELLKRCYGGGLSPTSRIDRLACNILSLQLEGIDNLADTRLYRTDETLDVKKLGDFELRKEDLIVSQPMGSSFTSRFGDSIKKDLIDRKTTKNNSETTEQER